MNGINEFYQESIDLEVTWSNIMIETVTADFKATSNANGIISKLVDVIKEIGNSIMTFILKRVNGFMRFIAEIQDMMKKLKMDKLNRIPDSLLKRQFNNSVSLNFMDNRPIEKFIDTVSNSNSNIDSMNIPQVGSVSKSFNSLEQMTNEFNNLSGELAKIKTKMSTLRGTFKQKTDKYVNVSKENQKKAENGDEEALRKIRETKTNLEIERQKSMKIATAYNTILVNVRKDMKTVIDGFNSNMPSKQEIKDL